MSGVLVVALSIGLIVLSAFFVAVEFSLLAAKRNRLETAALQSRSARAALRSSQELSLLLAGAQLGITVCTLGLGAVTKPAVHHALTPWMEQFGLSPAIAGVGSFVLALAVVTLLHLVIGEMAPKSWAIAHPEFVATFLAIPMRGFMWLTRPVLRAMNATANALVRRAGAQPIDTIAVGHDPRTLQQLIAHSTEAGTLNPAYERSLSVALNLSGRTLAELVPADVERHALGAEATIGEVQASAFERGEVRVVIAEDGHIRGIVHLRDTLTRPLDAGIAGLIRPVPVLPSSTSLGDAITSMQRATAAVAAIVDNGELLAVVRIEEILRLLVPQA